MLRGHLGHTVKLNLLHRDLIKLKPYVLGMRVEYEPEIFGCGLYIKFTASHNADDKLITIQVTRHGVCQVHLMHAHMLQIAQDFVYFTLFNYCDRSSE